MQAIDFYAGTGALGIEALSRRAAHSTFVEIDRAALTSIRKNLERLDIAGDATVLAREVERSRDALRNRGPYDLALSDPPWKISADAGVLVARTIQGLLSPDARVVLGHPASSPLELPPELGLELYDRRRWGDSGLSFFRIS
jgi:16S rRNA (guanine966-N2)-methyltransferase